MGGEVVTGVGAVVDGDVATGIVVVATANENGTGEVWNMTTPSMPARVPPTTKGERFMSGSLERELLSVDALLRHVECDGGAPDRLGETGRPADVDVVCVDAGNEATKGLGVELHVVA